MGDLSWLPRSYCACTPHILLHAQGISFFVAAVWPVSGVRDWDDDNMRTSETFAPKNRGGVT